MKEFTGKHFKNHYIGWFDVKECGGLEKLHNDLNVADKIHHTNILIFNSRLRAVLRPGSTVSPS